MDCCYITRGQMVQPSSYVCASECRQQMTLLWKVVMDSQLNCRSVAHLLCVTMNVVLEGHQLLHHGSSLTFEPVMLMPQLSRVASAPALLILIQLGVQQHPKLLL